MARKKTTSKGGGGGGAPQTRGRRFLRLARMTTSVAGRYALSRLKSLTSSSDEASDILADAHRSGGQYIAETLGELKGAVMKVGQMASIGTDWLPPELAEPLKALQQDAPPVDFEVIADQIESELGQPPELLFERFDREPFASASIGQVHRARTDDGREVVVKVQYPGIDSSVNSDLSQLKLALQAAGLLKLPRKVVRQLFRELQERLHEELDYTNEADNVRLFGDLFRDDPTVVVPEVVGERSSQRVLTLIYEEGTGLADVAPESWSQDERNEIALHIARIYRAMIFEHGVVHADPNPANFAVRHGGILVMYDFGCIKRLPDFMIEGYLDIVRAFMDRNYDDLDEHLTTIGARNPDYPAVDIGFYDEVAAIFIPVLDPEVLYDFGRAEIQVRLMAMAAKWRDLLGAFQPPVEGVFVNRALAGHYGTFCKLGSRVRLGELVVPLID